MRIRDYLTTVIFFLLIDYIWVYYCSTVWHAFFYLPSELSIYAKIVAYSIFALPICYRSRQMRASTLITLLIFLLGYIPIVVSLLNNYGGRANSVWMMHGVILFIIVTGSFYIEKKTMSSKVVVQRRMPINFLTRAALLVLLVQLLFFRTNIRLVSLTDVYELREQNSANVPVILRYIFSWSDTVLFPALFIIGVVHNRRRLLMLGLGALFLQYLIFGSKISLFLPVLLVVVSRVLNNEKWSNDLIKYFVMSIATISIALLLSYSNNEIAYLLSAIILMRGLTIPGVLYSGYYMPFFKENSYTYFSHVNVINELTGFYPYGDVPLGKVVSYDGMNANAIFFAMDGISGLGLLGVFIIGILYCIYIYFINRFVPKDRIKIFQIWMLVPTMALLNTSFFTFLLSEGAFLIFILILYVNFKEDTRLRGNVTV